MADTKLNDYPARLGDKQWVIVDHTGPASYTTGGETLGNSNVFTGVSAQGLGSIDAIVPGSGLSVSGTYNVVAQPVGAGSQKTFKLKWFGAGGTGSGTGVASVTITAGGTYTGTTPSVTFGAAPAGGTTATGVAILNGAGTAVIGVLVQNPGAGYLVAPTVTFGAGGATGTAVLASPTGVGSEVASTTNLSAETVRIGYVGR